MSIIDISITAQRSLSGIYERSWKAESKKQFNKLPKKEFYILAYSEGLLLNLLKTTIKVMPY